MDTIMFSLNLNEEENRLLLPTFAKEDHQELSLKLKSLGIKNHFLLSSSGTSGGDWKGYLISKQSLLRNAEAVNQRLKLNSSDIWGASLPYYHIGGLSIYIRASLLGHLPIDLRPWSPKDLSEKISRNNIKVISLVPTQVYDLVELNITSPKGLKVALVGGDFLSQELADRFKNLGWPLIKTFGMTEVSSQLCTGTSEAGDYLPLPIHLIKTDEDNNLMVRSQSFFSYIVKKKEDWTLTSISELLDYQGFLRLPDKAEIHEGNLRVLGRNDAQIKNSGHLINVMELREILERYALNHHCWGKMEIQIVSSERTGSEIVLHCLDTLAPSLIQGFLKLITPVKISDVKIHRALPRTKLGKFRPS